MACARHLVSNRSFAMHTQRKNRFFFRGLLPLSVSRHLLRCYHPGVENRNNEKALRPKTSRSISIEGIFLDVTMQQGIFIANSVTSRNILDTSPKYSIECRVFDRWLALVRLALVCFAASSVWVALGWACLHTIAY